MFPSSSQTNLRPVRCTDCPGKSEWSLKTHEMQNWRKLCVTVANLCFSDLVRVYTDTENDSSQEGESRSRFCTFVAYYKNGSYNNGRDGAALFHSGMLRLYLKQFVSCSRVRSLSSFCSRSTCPLCMSHLRSHRYIFMFEWFWGLSSSA